MTDPEQDPDLERNLSALFDRSAARPSSAERTRLLANAALIAKRGGPGALARVVWAPALAAAAAVAYLVAAPPGGNEPHPSPSAKASTSAPVAPSPSQPDEAVPPPATSEPEDPLAAVLGGDDRELEPFDLGPLMGGTPFGPRANDEAPAGMIRQRPWSNHEIERSPE